MARTELTPKDKENKKIISWRLNHLLNIKGLKQIDIHNQTGIPASTLTGYFKGTTLPSPGNVQKLANFFNVKKSEIDPRFEMGEKDDNGHEVDLSDKDAIFTYEGRKIPQRDLKIIKNVLKEMINEE